MPHISRDRQRSSLEEQCNVSFLCRGNTTKIPDDSDFASKRGKRPQFGSQPRKGRLKGILGPNCCAPRNPRSGMKKSNRKVPRVLEFRNHEAFIRDLVKKIPAEANKLSREAKKRHPDSERTRWTKAVKSVVHAVAPKLEKETVDFYGTRSEQEKKYHEWLLDAVLYVESRGILVAVESE